MAASPIISLVNDAKIETQDIPGDERPIGRHTVNHLAIHRCAESKGITAVSLECRADPPLPRKRFRKPVQLPGGHTRFDLFPQLRQYLRNNEIACPELFNLIRQLQDNHVNDPMRPAVMPASASSGNASFLHETLILPGQQMGFDLSRRIQGHADDNQKGRPSEIERDIERADQNDWEARRRRRHKWPPRRSASSRHHRYTRPSSLPGRIPGTYPPYFFMLSATSTGLKVTAV